MTSDATLPVDQPDRTAVEVDAKPWRQLCDLIEAWQRCQRTDSAADSLREMAPSAEEIRDAAARVVASARPLEAPEPAADGGRWLTRADTAFLLELGAAAGRTLAPSGPLTYRVLWEAEVAVFDSGGPEVAARVAHAGHAVLSARYRVVRGHVRYLVDLGRPPEEQLVDVEVIEP